MLHLLFLLVGNIVVSLISATQYDLRLVDTENGASWKDSVGNLYVNKCYCNQLYKINSTGQMTRIDIETGDYCSWFSGLYGDSTENILYLSQGKAIWKYNISSNITTLYAGNKMNEQGGDTMSPTSMFLSSAGMLYFVDYNRHRVRVINTNNDITETVAGNGEREYQGDNVPATSTSLNYPHGVWGNSLGFIFIADSHSNRIRVVNPAGIIGTFAGNGRYSGEWYISHPAPKLEKSELGDNSPATLASLQVPVDVKGDIEGNIFIAEHSGCRIRMVSSLSNIITTIIGDYCRYDVRELPLPQLNHVTELWVENKNTIFFNHKRRLFLATLREDSENKEDPTEEEHKYQIKVNS